MKDFGLQIRNEFPLLADSDLAYLDSAASSQKPRVVIERLKTYLEKEHANIHRGAYRLSAQATKEYDLAKEKIATFIKASSPEEIVFGKNATEMLNLLAYCCAQMLKNGDAILLTTLEHHSNIVPWQLAIEAFKKDIKLEYCKLNNDGSIDYNDLEQKCLQSKPKIISMTAQSNAFGYVTDLERVSSLALQIGSLLFVDGSQYIVHSPVDVKAINATAFVFTGHKLYGPTGIGVLWGKQDFLNNLPPFLGGGDMIESVSIAGSTFAKAPRRFEAGTPPIAEAIALGEAIDFINSIGMDVISKWEEEVFSYALERLSEITGVSVVSSDHAEQRSIISFNISGIHPHDFATIADSIGVNVRAGHHCAMPAMQSTSLHATIRASLGMYSVHRDIDMLIKAIDKAKQLFKLK